MISLSVSENETSFKLSSTWNRATLNVILYLSRTLVRRAISILLGSSFTRNF